MMNFNVHDLLVLLPEDFLLGAISAILLIDLFSSRRSAASRIGCRSAR